MKISQQLAAKSSAATPLIADTGKAPGSNQMGQDLRHSLGVKHHNGFCQQRLLAIHITSFQQYSKSCEVNERKDSCQQAIQESQIFLSSLHLLN